MAMPNLKNLPLSPAATDLGLGEVLKDQVLNEENLRRKKLANAGPSSPLLGTGMAAAALFGTGA